MKQKTTKLREGDEVIVISGKDKGKRGNISRIIGQRCICLLYTSDAADE